MFKKLNLIFYIFLKVCNYLFILPVFLLLTIISLFLSVRIKEIPTKRIGHLAIENNNYLYYKKLEKKKTLDLFFTEDFISNNFLLDLFKKKMKIFPRFVLGPILNINKILVKFTPIIKSFNFPNEYFVPRDVNNFIEFFGQNLTLPKLIKEKGDKLLSSLGIDKNQKIVCVILRDDEYLKKVSNINYDYHSYRNVMYGKFYKSIKYLLEKKYFVIRMGKIVQKKLEINHPNFIDYPFSKIKHDFMDIFLANRCEFVISSGTGWHEVPTIFNKPIVHITASLGTSSSYKSNNIFLTKKFKKNNINLNLEEIFKLGIAYFLSTDEFTKNEIEFEDPDEDQILESVKQMICMINDKFHHSYINNELQLKFRNLFDKNKKDVNGNIFHKKIYSCYNQKSLFDNF